MKPPRKWSEEEDRRLLELRTAGKTLIQIAKELNRTESSVAARIVVLKRQEKAVAEAEFSDGLVYCSMTTARSQTRMIWVG